jgi:small-conductance mechanosensitive channel
VLHWPRWITESAVSWQEVAVALAIAAGVFAALWFVRLLVRRKRKAYAASTGLEALELPVLALSRTTVPFMVVVAGFAALQPFDLPPRLASLVLSVAMIALFWQAGLWASAATIAWLEHRGKVRASEGKAVATSLGILRFAAQALIWSMVVLLTLDNVGVDITALVAGLGIGGVAVALALQNVLGDLFASLSIALDQPFVVGDFIATGEHLGTVDYIGIKSTRIRSLAGEQIVMPNAELLAKPVRNFKRMQERRVVFTVGLEYETPRERLERVPAEIRRIVEATPDVRFDRCHFSGFGNSALEFETVYFVKSADFNRHMDLKQEIYLQICAAFERLDVSFAYPTQRLWLANPPVALDRGV